MIDYKKPIENLASDVKDYVDLRVDDLKLKTTMGLSVTLARILSTLVILFVLGMVIISLTVAFVLMVGHLTGNYALGAFIATAIFLVAFVVLFSLRKKMFAGSFVRMFIQIFYPEDYE